MSKGSRETRMCLEGKMNGKFFDLKKEKQDRMINGALKVFAMQGYRHASTDEIVKEADISKGLLFHYFGSKIGLYTFIYDYSVKFVTLELRACVDPLTVDLFDLMKQMEQAKMHVMRAYPYMQQFLNRAIQENVSEALLAVEEKRNIWVEACENWYQQVDLSLLPYGVDGYKLRKMLELTIKGLMSERLEDHSFQPEMLYAEICDYLDMMKRIVYR